MNIPDTELWRVHFAALWILTRNPDVRKAGLYGNGIGPWCNAIAWLEEHKSEILHKFRGRSVHFALGLAFDELSREVWDERLMLYDEDGKPLNDSLKDFERDFQVWVILDDRLTLCDEEGPPVRDLKSFKSVSKLRAWIEDKRPYVRAQELVKRWPVPQAGRPRNAPDANAPLAEAVKKLRQTGLSERKACEKLYHDGEHKLQSAEATRRKCQRAKKRTLTPGA